MSNRFAKVFVNFLLAALLPLSASGQSNEGALAGSVTDPSGNAVVGATVMAANTATGQSLSVETGATGTYRFPALIVGNYNVTATLQGFKSVQRTNVAVQVQTTTTLDIALPLGVTTETVQITANAPQLQTEAADVGTVVTPRQVVDLPLSTNGSSIRNSQDFVFLAPATYGTGTNGGTFEGGVSGGQAFGSEILYDGASLQVESFGDGFANEILPSVEATGEFKVLLAGVPAQYGRTSGGIQSYTSKSGTNDFHGGVFELFKNDDLDANTWFNNLSKSQSGPSASNAVPSDKKNEYGVLLGGPLWVPKVYNGRNKTFFFFAWEQFKQVLGDATLVSLPTPANLHGDFSANLTTNQIGVNPCDNTPIYQGQVFDPTTTRTVNGVQCRTAYPGNIITTPLSPVAVAVTKFIPQATNALSNNYNYVETKPIIDTTESIRIDHSFGDHDKIFGSYNVRQNARPGSTIPNLQLPVTPYHNAQNLPTHLVRVGYDHIFSPNLLNHTLIAFTRVYNHEGYNTPSQGKDYAQLLGVPGGSGPYFPGFNPNEGSGQGQLVNFGDPLQPNNNGYNSSISDNSYYFGDNVSWTKGRHNLSIGGEFRYAFSISDFVSQHNGTFNFGREQTAATIATSAASGNGFASMLLGQVVNSTVKQNFISVHNVAIYDAIYIQDEFKYSKSVNLSLGLRYDVDLPFKELHNHGSQFSPTAINTGAAGTGTPGALVFSGKGPGLDGLSSRWSNVYFKNIEPRIGITWVPPFLNQKTVISATYNVLNAPILQWQQIYGGVPAGYSFINQLNNGANPFGAAELLDPGSPVTPGIVYPGQYGVPPIPSTPSFDRSQRNGNQVNYTKRDFGRPGLDMTWSATLQQQLGTDLIFTLGYLGERGVRLGSNLLWLDDINPSQFAFGARLNDTFAGNGTAVDGVAPPYAGFTGPLGQALRPFPQYGTATDGYSPINTGAYGENHGQLTYNALTAKLERRFHDGLNLLASYTWSKNLTDTGNIIGGSLGGSYTASIQNPFNLKAEKALSPEDIPQIFVMSYIYELPFGNNKMFLNKGGVANYVVGGWSFTGIQRYQTGQPLGFGCATSIPGFDNCIRWNLVPGQQIESAARRNGTFNPGSASNNLWYNRAAFSDPNANVSGTTPYQFGNKPAYQGNDRSHDYDEEDFGLLKRIPITERIGLQFRAEYFNAFNRHVFGGPNNNPNNAGFGTIGSLNNNPRQGQLTLRVEF
jgi:Carboxypeptidase regulatory-like domain